jgi:hypothetical protein
VMLESFSGLVFSAAVMGVLFAKLSRPVGRVTFAKYALYEAPKAPGGFGALVIRFANERRTPLLNATMGVSCMLRRNNARGDPACVHPPPDAAAPSASHLDR